MTERRAGRRWVLGIASVLTITGAVAAGFHAPHLLRELEMFRVEHVEVLGVRYLEPYAVLRAAGIGEGSSVFDSPADWREGVLALPLVVDARVRRRFPSTVAIEVREVEPVALLAGGDLRPVDAQGRILDLEPAGAILDLPILMGGTVDDGRLVGPAAASALHLLVLLRDHPGAWSDRVSQVELMAAGLRVVFRGDGPDALMPLRPDDMHVTRLRLAYADLDARGELGRARRIDVRFRDQVVVSFLRNPVS
jgi:hypothetical protein